MKRLYIILLIGLFCGTSYAQTYKGLVDIEFKRVEILENNKVLIDMDIRIAAKAMTTKQSWTITPEIYTDRKELRLPYVLINGKNKRQMYERKVKFGNVYLVDDMPWQVVDIDYRTNNVIPYRIEVDFEEWMADADVRIRQELTSCREQKRSFTVSAPSFITVAPAEPAAPFDLRPAVAIVVPEKTRKTRSVSDKAYLEFQTGRSEILPGFRNNYSELSKIDRSLEEVRRNPDATITSLFVEGYASPEGSYSSNLNLSSSRAEALRQYIIRNSNVSSGIIRSAGRGEDWAGLRELVNNNLHDYKWDILAIIDSDMNPDTKEARMKVVARGYPYQLMYRDFYPQLRRVDYRIDYTIRDYDVEETRVLLEKTPSSLSHYELYLLASSYETRSERYFDTFERIASLYPDDPVAVANRGAVLIERGQIGAAKNILDAERRTAEVLTNLGVIALYEDDDELAEAYLVRARDMGSKEAVHNLTELSRKREHFRR